MMIIHILYLKKGPYKVDYIDTHRFSVNHKEELLKDKKCGCFYCLKVFDLNLRPEDWQGVK